MRKSVSSVILVGTLAASLSACGSSTSKSASAPATAPSTATAAVKPVAALTNLTGTSTAVKLAPAFVAALGSLKLTPGVVGTAKLTAGSLIFPITGGTATYYTPGSRTPYVESNIKHDGSGFSLTDGKTKVELTNFVVDAGTSMLTGDVSANGKSVVKGAPLFFLDGRTLKPLDTKTEAGKAILEGTKVELTKAAADLLNTTYKVTALKPFFVVGVAKITLALPK